MPTLGENPSQTPILDGLLVNFDLSCATRLVCNRVVTNNIKRELAAKARRGILTKEDIERGLQSVPRQGLGGMEDREEEQRSILAYLIINYRELFRQLTGFF